MTTLSPASGGGGTESAERTDEAAAPTSVERLARRVTDVLQPRNVPAAGMTGIGLAATGDGAGRLWGLLGALCAGIVPASYIEWERRRGTWGDRHMVDRRQRAPIFFVILSSLGAGTAAMIFGGAPAGILTSMYALWVMTVVLLAVNAFWKISVDSAVASAVPAMLAVVHSPWWLAAFPGVAAVCWSRVALEYHSVAQTVAGAATGAATTAIFTLV